MTAKPGNGDDVVAEINVTPLVDIMLVLLIIFMVTATLIKDPVVPVKLPHAATAQDAPANSIAVVLDQDGILFVNGREATPLEVRQRLVHELARDSHTAVVVAADGRLEYNRVAQVIDLVKSTGVPEFALNVRRPLADGNGGQGSSP